jgi:glycosyltransferase involved in cell wall biosynthesis/Flp pilus assembly protein TadD
MRRSLAKWVNLSRTQTPESDQASRLRALRAAGDEERDRRNWEDAVRIYTEVIAIDPSALDIAVQLGHAHKESGDYYRAAELYYSVLDKTPDDDDLHLQIGHLEKMRGNLVEALAHYERAADINPRNPNAQLECDALKTSGDDDETVAAGRLGWSGPSGDNGTDARRSPIQLNPAALRAAGDQARNAGLWAEAAPAYQAYLGHIPTDAAIWVQLGHCLKETGDLAASEAAYRQALPIKEAEDADLYLQLGHVVKLQGRSDEAVEAYRRSFALKPLLGAGRELRSLGVDLASELKHLEPPARTPEILFEISDLFADLLDARTISGIQRVQLGLISYIIEQHGRGEALHCHVVVWDGDELWRLPEDCLTAFLRTYELIDDGVFERRYKLIAQQVAEAELLRAAPGDIVVSTGTIYRRTDILKADARLKRAGALLGAYIHDFIPLSHPEFCAKHETESFAFTIADALLQYDFALTVSEHVGQELRRLLMQGGYPAIPIRAVPEAHGLTAPLGELKDAWTPTIAALRDHEFVLCVGTLCARKNQALLLQIWLLLIRDAVEPPMLVLVGRRGHNINELLSQLEATNYLDGRVIVLEGLVDDELATLYRNCLFTMFPSFAEGWGLPVGESLAYGKVCIASDATSLPEVGGDFVLYIDPYNARDAACSVRRLLDDRGQLERFEARIRNEFRPRTWQEHGTALIRAVEELARAKVPAKCQPKPIVMPFGKMVRPSRISTGWQYGTCLPPRQVLADQALRRLLLEKSWYPMESWGTWMEGHLGQIGLTIGGEPGSRVLIVLQFQAAPWAQGNQLRIRAPSGTTTTVAIPESRRTAGNYPHFLAWLDCTADKSGHIELSLEILGAISEPWWGETRRFCVGLTRLLCLDPAEIGEWLPPNRIVRPAALIASTGAAINPCSTSTMITTLRRRIMLVDGWLEPEAWGAWMTGGTAHLALGIGAALSGDTVSVALQLRAPPGRHTDVTVYSECDATGPLHISAIDPRDFALWLDCRVGADGQVRLAIEATSRLGSMVGNPQTPPLGITGFAYGRKGSLDDRLALAEALLFRKLPEGETEVCRTALGADLRFSVIGHTNGSYSLAAVNRRLALALEGARPGTVRIEQIEGQPVHDLSRVPAAERPAITALAARERHEDGYDVEIAQHWPIWVPPHSADLKLAWIPWEESLVPLDMVRLLNERFQGILAQTRFVVKALIDSGVRLPIRLMGCAPDIDAYAALGAERAAALASRQTSKAAPFVFLHVSSCFPRKGVDALLAAYARAFQRDDPVRLIIKGFPNPHNDVPAQIAHLRRVYPDIPEIVMVNRDLSASELIELYRGADAAVLPTRGEGFNIPAAEALAAGLPLIVTGYSGHTDFAGPDVARQVEFHFSPSRTHLHSYGSVWADPDVEDLAAAMREVFDAAGDPVKRQALIARVDRGRRLAVSLGNAAAWAARVREIALDLLSLGPMDKPVAPTVAWVTTWNIRCGIATYSRYLLDRYPDAARGVIVLCDERTQPADLASPGCPAARVGWRWQDPETADRLAREITATGARVVVIQHQPGLIWPESLIRLLGDDRLADHEIILILHNLRELVDCEDWDRLLDILRGVSRLLVHNVHDLNLLKSLGLVGNVTLFPHGALQPAVERRPVRELPRAGTPIIGTYGFFLPHKGFDVLIEALAKIGHEWPGARLRMVTAEHTDKASPSEIARCRALAQSLGLENVIEWHTDYLPDDGSLTLLNRCDLIVLPHRDTSESASGAVRVAMASRVPVLVTPVRIFGEMDDAVIRAGGLDSSALASGIGAALRNPKLRDQTVDEADRWLETHEWARVSERLYGMICGLVANRHSFAPVGVAATRVSLAAPSVAEAAAVQNSRMTEMTIPQIVGDGSTVRDGISRNAIRGA